MKLVTKNKQQCLLLSAGEPSFKFAQADSSGQISVGCIENEIDSVMEWMDLQYKSSFAAWVRSEENVQFVAKRLVKLFLEYEVEEGLRVVEWIWREWSKETKLKFISALRKAKIKLERFYLMEMEKFVQLIKELCRIMQ